MRYGFKPDSKLRLGERKTDYTGQYGMIRFPLKGIQR